MGMVPNVIFSTNIREPNTLYPARMVELDKIYQKDGIWYYKIKEGEYVSSIRKSVLIEWLKKYLT